MSAVVPPSPGPAKIFLHPIPYLIAFLTLMSGILSQYFHVGVAYTFPFAILIAVFTALNVKYTNAHPDWTIDIPTSWIAALQPILAMTAGIVQLAVALVTGPESPYAFSPLILAIFTATVLIVNWLASALQEIKEPEVSAHSSA